MPTTSVISIKELSLDLKNFRTIPQKRESNAVKAMISIKPERFFAIMESIIEDGYLPTENIIVLKDGNKYIVKEGNRRIAALKLIHGQLIANEYGIPESILESIRKLDAAWKNENLSVPCTIFSKTEEGKVDRIVTLAHGKGEKASRDPWSSVARARHNRDVNKRSEPGLDLLESYLKHGNNLNNQQKERWSGEYKVTILDEALRKIHSRLDCSSAAEAAKAYPKIKYRTNIENILLDIGLEQITFETVRSTTVDFADLYGIKAPQTPPKSGGSSGPSGGRTNGTGKAGTGAGGGTTTGGGSTGGSKAYGVNDPRQVSILLKKFTPRGNNRQKVVALLNEIKKLKVKDNPIAFCFLLRSMFEISAKAYSSEHSISLTKSGGKEKTLVELLSEITKHLTNNNANTAMVKVLHGAMTEMGQPNRILSVTSMNQLVHNTSFSVSPPDICTLFSNIYPLLEAMN